MVEGNMAVNLSCMLSLCSSNIYCTPFKFFLLNSMLNMYEFQNTKDSAEKNKIKS